LIRPPQQRGLEFLWRRGLSLLLRKIKSPKGLAQLWEEYKAFCNNQSVLTHDFSAKNSEFVSKELKRSVTYTIEGFCVYAGLSRSAFYKNYADNPAYVDIARRMKEECEVDARMKFELSVIPPQLAALWMGKHGYKIPKETTEDFYTKDITVLEKIEEHLKNGKSSNNS
jgi:hypothetical protein